MSDLPVEDPAVVPEPSPQLWTAFVRTAVPYLTAFVVAKAAEKGVNLDSEEVSGAIVLVGGSLWYTVVRWLETKNAKFGWLLGSPNAPTYEK